ncbi:MAG: DUF11 domain-containing protein, partial [Candidatus Eisenbacteria bacterium]|nr:DUF11 domain-containing protein [Candidatus Eisenbacteria bacterium]
MNPTPPRVGFIGLFVSALSTFLFAGSTLILEPLVYARALDSKLGTAHAGPLPGTRITGIAIGHGLVEPALTPIAFESDSVVAIVSALEALELYPTHRAVLAGGATGAFAHRLRNSGNVAVTARLELANLAGDGYDLADLAMLRDLDRDGAVSAGDAPLVSGATVALAVGDSADLVITFAVPLNAPDRTTAWLRVLASAVGSNVAAQVTDSVSLEAAAAITLMAEKSASPEFASFGDAIEYQVRVANRSDSALASVRIEDQLPAGFSYEVASARRDGVGLADPAGVTGRTLAFTLGALGAQSSTTLRYRARLGPAVPLGDAVNEAVAISGTARSNVARARVRVTGGVFAEEAVVFGTVYLDSDRDGRRSADERGVPGVRLYADQGSWVITDADGRYSLTQLAPRTHALKLDPLSLPSSARPRATRHRDRGAGGLAFVDLQRGDLQRADFALEADLPADSVLRPRREHVAGRDPLGAAVRRMFNGEPLLEALGDPRARPSTGVLDAEGPLPLYQSGAIAPAHPNAAAITRVPVTRTPRGEGEIATEIESYSVTSRAVDEVVASGGIPATTTEPPNTGSRLTMPLEDLVLQSNRELVFLGLRDGDTLSTDRATVVVKGVESIGFELSVNGDSIPRSRVGRRVHSMANGVEAWEYYGVALAPGVNELVVMQHGSGGARPASARVRVIAPDHVARLELRTPRSAPAD